MPLSPTGVSDYFRSMLQRQIAGSVPDPEKRSEKVVIIPPMPLPPIALTVGADCVILLAG